MGTVTGESAYIALGSHAAGDAASLTLDSLWGISDFSLTLDRGTVEQELVGEIGNYFTHGSLSVEGSYTCCKFGASGNSDALENILGNIQYITISGSTGANLSWYFRSCQITGYDISMGDADTITEASIDWVVLNAHQVTFVASTGHMED